MLQHAQFTNNAHISGHSQIPIQQLGSEEG